MEEKSIGDFILPRPWQRAYAPVFTRSMRKTRCGRRVEMRREFARDSNNRARVQREPTPSCYLGSLREWNNKYS